MTPERFRRIEEVFAAAADMPPESRAPYLAVECANDPDLLQEVNSLLAESAGASERLGTVVEAGAAAVIEEEPPPVRRAGAYRILEPIAGGGMGSVYRGVRDDGQFDKQVAIKLLHDVLSIDATFVQRFLEERRILARMEHPNVARLLDGGVTAEQVPYLVMELIDGKPITTWCAEQQATLLARIALFREVCAAVHYAHQNLVVHRDIKPANILVTPEGGVKLLDFGVAKGLESDRTATRSGMGLMTLDYASPEQVRGDPITTATDVYSLGLLLYELLAGQRAHALKNHSPSEIIRVICEEDPPPPSVASNKSELSGDLDNIILKATRKDPARRYASVEQFSGDLERYLNGLPVTARRNTIGYRTAKFIRRYRAITALAVLSVLLLVGGILLTLRQARIAERRFAEVRSLANAVVFEFDAALQNIPGTTPARKLIIDRTTSYLNTLSRDAAGNRELQRELAAAYEKVGDVQGNPALPNLGDAKGALATYGKAVELRKELRRVAPNDIENRALLVKDYGLLGSQLTEIGDAPAAIANYQAAIAEGKGYEQASVEIGRYLAPIYMDLGELQAVRENVASALPLIRQGVELLESTAKRFPAEDLRKHQATAYSKYSRALWRASDLPQALAYSRRAFDLRQARVKAAPDNLEANRDLWLTNLSMGDILGSPVTFSLNRTEDALLHYRAALALAEKAAASDPKSYRANRDLMVTLNRLGDALRAKNAFAEASATYERSLGIVTKLEATDHRPGLKRDLAITLDRAGDALMGLNRKADGIARLRQALEIRRALVAADPNAEARRDLMLSQVSLGAELKTAGLAPEAAGHFREALKTAEALAAKDPSDALSHRYITVASEKLAAILVTRQEWKEARELYKRSLTLLDDLIAKGKALESDKTARNVLVAELARCEKALTKK